MKNRCLRLTRIAVLGLLGISAGTTMVLSQTIPGQPNPRLLNAELLARGKQVFLDHCSGCHGEKGDGQGPGAYGLNPKPRDFTVGIFKFRSTPSGSLPTDEDLVRTVKQGVLGTSMPAFDLMSDRDALAVAQYLKVFSDKWRDRSNFAPPVAIPPPPAWVYKPEDRARHAASGKELFTAACVACHGELGDGKGLAAATLVDAWNRAITPADLRQPYIRGGRNWSDIYKVLVTGVDGTPMPNMAEALTEEQRWDLIAFINQLREEKRGHRGGMAAAEPANSSTPAAPAAAPVPAQKKEAASQYE